MSLMNLGELFSQVAIEEPCKVFELARLCQGRSALMKRSL